MHDAGVGKGASAPVMSAPSHIRVKSCHAGIATVLA